MSDAQKPTSDLRGPSRFGGEKAKDYARDEAMLPDEHANSTGRSTSDEEIVAAEFSGLENDIFDINTFAGDGTGQVVKVGPEDEKREDLRGEPSAAQAVKERGVLKPSD